MFLELLNTVVSFGLITVLFAMMFKFLPDVEVRWGDVWFGAIITAALFTVGKVALGSYLGKSSVVTTYEASGALLIVLLWVYFSAQILYYGVELTQEYAKMKGHSIQPSLHAESKVGRECPDANIKTENRGLAKVESESAKSYVHAYSAFLPANQPRSATSAVKRQPRVGYPTAVWGGLLVLGLITFTSFRAKVALVRRVWKLLS